MENLTRQFLFFYELDIDDCFRELVYTITAVTAENPLSNKYSGFFC